MSGYFFNDTRHPQELEASHAWIEAWIPGFGWAAYDPTHDRLADDSPRRNDLGPHALRRAGELHRQEFAPGDTFIIGDTPHDIECGRVIGARTIAVATGRHPLPELAAHSPTAVFPDFADTAAFLRVIDGGGARA